MRVASPWQRACYPAYGVGCCLRLRYAGGMIKGIIQFARNPLRDRERLQAFARFTWRRFVEDRCTQAAGALAHTTLFATVPLMAAVLGILAAFPGFADWRDRVSDFVFANFVPAAGTAIQDYITQFADNASQATVIGVLVLLFSAIALMMSIEDAFNRIWRVTVKRSTGARLLVFWAALTLGPLLLVAVLAITSYIVALPFTGTVKDEFSLATRLLSVVPFIIVLFGLLASYLMIPNRTVRLRDAFIGAAIAAVLFELAKRGFAFYVGNLASYQRIYGALAVIPIFIMWIYVSWVIVLLGASITASLNAFDYRPSALRLPRGQEFAGLLPVMRDFIDAQRDGRQLRTADLMRGRPYLSDTLAQRYLAGLAGAGIIHRTESGAWVLARDIASTTLADLYESGDYRIPTGDIRLPDDGHDEALRLLNGLRDDIRAGLDVRLAEVFPPAPPPDPPTTGNAS